VTTSTIAAASSTAAPSAYMRDLAKRNQLPFGMIALPRELGERANHAAAREGMNPAEFTRYAIALAVNNFTGAELGNIDPDQYRPAPKTPKTPDRPKITRATVDAQAAKIAELESRLADAIARASTPPTPPAVHVDARGRIVAS
jgi:hypothetical protein